ncbi:T9SS type A sorting domain-containing protein [Echinicola sp. CAU 1574]|uniref:T9SS type A sorting domain-containing protein n=1 Tax=Echinicola arenosa TaxID=2774144 RepID=A0ABR9ALD1_9BACT|nr:LamG-like jellyroll fold domain-containing protein [Echinicola arenosa]MBD8489520.1 T9SS type A sorting domain-containing protein [Echinicola arenosa]
MIFTFIHQVKKVGLAYFLTFLLTGFIIHQNTAQTLAFPGAEGVGRFSEGGRNGAVYIVTNLNDSGPGSFRDAVSQPNRIVVFEVGGIIQTESRIIVARNVTIAGQTAPGDGVVIYGDGITFTQASNSIVRYLRVRMGRYGTSGADAMTMTDNANNLIFDHVSASWGRDETFSITGHADSITIQNSIISQGLETHSCGGLMEPSGVVSLFRNLYIDNNTRNPKVKNRNQFVNNVVYNWGRGGGYIMGGSSAESRVNIVNNYYIDGPSTSIRPFSRGTESFIPYVEGNYHDGNLNGMLDGSLVERSAYDGITTFADSPYGYDFPEQVMTAQESYAYVLENVGANYPRRDQVDEFLMTELTSLGLEGKLISNERELPTGGPGQVFGAPAKTDSDRDGIPDDWETANGLDPSDASDAMQIGVDGYTNIEHYINGILEQSPEDFLRPISALSFDDVSPYSVVLDWVNNDSRYEGIVLERAIGSGDFIVLDSLAGNPSELLIEGLSPNTNYRFRLKPFGGILTAVPSEALNVKTIPVPSAPAETILNYPKDGFGFADTTSLELRWTGSENTDFYLLYKGNNPENLELIDSLTTNEYQLTDLMSDQTYFWKVDAGNELGLTEGAVWSFTTRPYIARGLVGAWLMDHEEGTLVADSSTFIHDGEINELNDFSWAEGKVNNALDFNNAENPSHVFVPHADQLYFDEHSFAISMWLKSSNPTSQSYLIHKGTFSANATTGGTGQWYGIEIKDGNLRFAVDDNEDKTELSTTADPIFSGEWTHLVAIRDRQEGVLKVYINGEKVNETNDRTKNSIGQLEPIILGNSNGFGTPFRGYIDEVKLFNKRLTDQEVLELFHTLPTPIKAFSPSLTEGQVLEGYGDTVTVSWKGGVNTTSYQIYLGEESTALELIGSTSVNEPNFELLSLAANKTYFWRVDALGPKGTTTGDVWSFKAAAPASLVGHWKMDEQTGTLVEDYSDYKQDAMAQGFAGTDRVVGKFGQAYQFDSPSSTASINVPNADHLLFDETSFTISLWVKIPEDTYRYNNNMDSYLIHKGSFADNWYGIQLRDGNLTFAIDDDRTKTSITTSVSNSSSHPLFTDEWVHLVAIRDKENKKLKFYLNGEQTAETNYFTGKTGKASPVRLGNSDENKPFRDRMDDVRLYNYALKPAEIEALFHAYPKLEVVYKNGDIDQLQDNQIRPNFKLVNKDTLAVDLQDITARYWFTPENSTSIQTRLDYAALGSNQVNMNYVALSEPRTGAFGYVEYTFQAESMLGLGADSGEIKAGIFDNDWSDFDEYNDHSMMEAGDFTINPHITLYQGESLIWGNEPQPEAPERKAKVYLKHHSSSHNTLKKSFNLVNDGNVPLEYEGLSFRYWFTKDGEGTLGLKVDYAALGKQNIQGTFMEVSGDHEGADHYLSLQIDESIDKLPPLSETGQISIRITKSNWADFVMENDYSNSSETDWVLEDHVTVYYYGKLIFGEEPSVGSNDQMGNRMLVDENYEEVENINERVLIKVFPNPSKGMIKLYLPSDVSEPVDVSIYDVNGLKKIQKSIDESVSTWDISEYSSGIYFMYVNIKGERIVHKIIKN